MGEITRRTFLRGSASALATTALLSPTRLFAGIPANNKISFYHTHTGEEISLFVHRNGVFSRQDKSRLFTFLRDFRTGDIHQMDVKLFQTLAKIKDITGSKGVYEVISGYRSPKTNDMLRAKTSGVAKKSYHMKGQAIDIRLTDVKTSELRDVAKALKAGGVGYYRKSDFIHLDTGPVRAW